jgi:hypothetical protein
MGNSAPLVGIRGVGRWGENNSKFNRAKFKNLGRRCEEFGECEENNYSDK